MKLLITQEDFAKTPSRGMVKLYCFNCKKSFERVKNQVQRAVKRRTAKYCSRTCARQSTSLSKNVVCENCGKMFLKQNVEILRSSKHFCSLSCAAKYNNRNKNLGKGRRSKAEDYLFNLIQIDFPELQIIQNERNLLSSGLEIDILIPNIKLAIELNGPTHYFPLFGEEKLKRIQLFDLLKQNEIIDLGYKLIIVDISSQNYFKKIKVMLDKHYLAKIKPIIKLSMPRDGVEPSWDCSR